MCGAGEARVIAANSYFNPIKYAFGDFSILDILSGYLIHGAVHGSVVMTSSHNQVDLAYFAACVYPIMMEKCSPGGFNYSYRLFVKLSGVNPYFL